MSGETDVIRWPASPHYESFVDGLSELECMITDSQIVLQSERLQHNTVSYRECQTQVITGIT